MIYWNICEITLCLSCNKKANLICGDYYLCDGYGEYKNRVRVSNTRKRLYKKHV